MNDDERRVGLLRTYFMINLGMMLAFFWYYTRHVRDRVSRSRKRARKYSVKGKKGSQRAYMKRLTLLNDVDCKNSLRMNKSCFLSFCNLLADKGGLKTSMHVTLEEKVATFLAVIGHHTKHRVAMFAFRRSGWTVSTYFNEVLQCVLKLHKYLLAPPVPVPDTCEEEPWCHFKGCLGALDGTYIKVKVPVARQANYRNRKGFLSVNVLGVCNPDMKFIYVLTGWEGSAADSRVLRDAMRRETYAFSVERGNYYLVDAGYMNAPGFLPPFRKTRYHIKEWSNCNMQPKNAKEYYNLKHSQARNVIERAWGLLKKRFGILREPSCYPLDTANDIILACCLVHNYLRDIASDDLLENEKELEVDPLSVNNDDEYEDFENVEDDDSPPIDVLKKCPLWKQYRRNLASMMFLWYKRRYIRRKNARHTRRT